MTIQEDNIFLRIFQAHELYCWFQQHFPGSAPITIHGWRSPCTADSDKWEIWSIEKNGDKPYHPDHRTEYSLQPEQNCCVFMGRCGNTITTIRFVIQDEWYQSHVVNWTFDPYQLPGKNYATAFAALILETSGHLRANPSQGADYCSIAQNTAEKIKPVTDVSQTSRIDSDTLLRRLGFRK